MADIAACPGYNDWMRYLVRARVKPGKEKALLRAIETGALGRGSIAGNEYLRDMLQARVLDDGSIRWLEVCFCWTPLEEERPYWEEYFDLLKVQDAHDRRRCRDENGTEPWACGDCDCTEKLEVRMESWGSPFVDHLRRRAAGAQSCHSHPSMYPSD